MILKYSLYFILWFLFSISIHYIGINKILEILNIYKIGLIINLLLSYLILYNTITMLIIIYTPLEQIENKKWFRFVPKFIKNYLSLYNVKNSVVVYYLFKLLLLGIVVSMLVLTVINILFLYYI